MHFHKLYFSFCQKKSSTEDLCSAPRIKVLFIQALFFFFFYSCNWRLTNSNQRLAAVVIWYWKWQPFFLDDMLDDASVESLTSCHPWHLQKNNVVPLTGWYQGRRVWMYLSDWVLPGQVVHRVHPQYFLYFLCACGVCEIWKATGACRHRKSAVVHSDRLSYTVPLLPLWFKERILKKLEERKRPDCLFSDDTCV